MIYLSGVVRPDLPSEVGLMLQPGSNRLPEGITWAADNGCYGQGENFRLVAWLGWLKRYSYAADRCLFAVAPDVVGEAQATLDRSLPILPLIRELGYKVALTAQDGLQDLEVPWDAFDALFIGGRKALRDEWKLSHHAARLVAEAKARGKWTHMGRVNSLRRLQAAVLMDCDSADGTFLAHRARVKGQGDRARRGVPELRGWLGRLRDEPFLPLVPLP